ncbi:hypothetical protein BDF14DRAFT_1867450 [Spinellus fusiger]|nr:hypothetical protein BDF14DRAFT_1867450 [Spinellus fusiger]
MPVYDDQEQGCSSLFSLFSLLFQWAILYAQKHVLFILVQDVSALNSLHTILLLLIFCSTLSIE